MVSIMWLNVVLAILATYRIAHLFPYDDGPFYVFKRIRQYTDRKAVAEQESRTDGLGFWTMVNDGVTCPYCVGLYVAALCGVLVSFPSMAGNLFLIIFALAGAQSLLQRWHEK